MTYLQRTIVLGLLALAPILGCSSGPSDTGYVGTWKRGGSVISIRQADDGYHFRWSKSEPQTVRCSRDDFCEEFAGDQKIHEHHFRLHRREGSPLLFLEATITSVPDDGSPIHYVDQIEVQPGGQELWSTMIEAGGKVLEERQTLIYAKVADEPF